MTNPKFNILVAASEVVGFSKTGGLADVVGSLPRALEQRGHNCAIIAPLYRCTRNGKVPIANLGRDFNVTLGDRTVRGGFWRATLPNSSTPVYLVEQSDFYERDDPAQGRGLYHFTLPNGQKHDYPDNCARYTFFCRAVMEALTVLDLKPDVIQLNDWQTGLVPVYLRELYPKIWDLDRHAHLQRIRTLFTIHNIAYQGKFWYLDLALTGLDQRLFNYQQLEFNGDLSYLKAGIVFADLVNTVSPRYAEEIQTPYFGCGLEGVLIERRDRLSGIVNGADYDVWNPATDTYLPTHYDAATVSTGKPICKAALQHRFGLDPDPRAPLLGIVSRLAYQKGMDLVGDVAASMIEAGVQWVILGEGDKAHEEVFQSLHKRFPNRFGLVIGFNEALAHQIEAGADIFVMPSLYEPSGLNQLYSLKYGTVPVVRATGGLANTVVNCTPESMSAGTATGFSFVSQYAGDLLTELLRAVEMYREQPETWRQLMQSGMRQDWSWRRSAGEYEALYARMMSKRFGERDH